MVRRGILQSKGGLSFRFLIFLVFFAALIPIAAVGWQDLYRGFLERNAPKIIITDFPRGIGLAPVSITMKLTDSDSGLDEVVVRIKQRNTHKEMRREVLHGEQEAVLTVDFPGDRSSLDEGTAQFEVRAFDRSFWSNSAEVVRRLDVDYRRPKIEVLTSQHNATQGGSQIVFYKAFDESLAISGIKVGNRTFLGFPASGIDENLKSPNIFVAIYAIDIEQGDREVSVRAFAEDSVGNATSVPFYNKIQMRSWREATVKVTEDLLRDAVTNLYQANANRLTALEESLPNNPVSAGKGGTASLIQRFVSVNQILRQLDEQEVRSFLKGPRFERFWEGPLLQQPGSIQGLFGDQITFFYEGKLIGEHVRHGYEIYLPVDSRDVYAASAGIVVFAENIGTLGHCVAIDHGLGIMSLYGYLDNVLARRGDHVKAGQKIAIAGGSGLSQGPRLYFEVRVHDVPVDAREWWDKRWFYAHVTAKINEVKRILGLPVYIPLG